MPTTTIYIFKQNEEAWKKAIEIARREGKSISKLINDFIVDYVKKHAEGNPSFTLDHFAKGIVVKALPSLGHDPAQWNWDDTPVTLLNEIKQNAQKWLEAADYHLQVKDRGYYELRKK